MTDLQRSYNSAVFGPDSPDAIYTTYAIALAMGCDMTGIPVGSCVCVTKDGIFVVEEGSD